ncbi:unnamed protein product [Closterium sp. Naga37s-1]|nr:unnamed protein product [Closterium sp. Naga37s-1]
MPGALTMTSAVTTTSAAAASVAATDIITGRTSSGASLSVRAPQGALLGWGSRSSFVPESRRLAVASANVARRAAPMRGARGVRASGGGAPNGAADISQEFKPAAQFYKVEAVIRPWRLSHVCEALFTAGIRGLTVSNVRGFGTQGTSRERHAGSEFADDALVLKSKLEVVVVYDQVEAVIAIIIEEARTGEIGDGKIFVSPVAEVIRVRTGERGIEAERMAGGRMDLLEAAGKGASYVAFDGYETS